MILYDGQLYDFVQNEGRSRFRWKQPKRIYYTLWHARTALRGIIDCIETAKRYGSYRRKDEPERDPAKFEIVEYTLVETKRHPLNKEREER